MKKSIVLFILLLAVINTAAAYTRITSSSGRTPKWLSMPVTYWIDVRGNSQIANDSEFNAVQSAFATWQNIPTANIRFNYRGTTPVHTVGRDGMNVISFADETTPLGSGTLAATFSFFSTQSGEFITTEADILFNPSQNWSTSGESGRYDIQSVLTHEVGHLLGLDHSALVSSVMAPFASQTQVNQRTLMYDDIAGVSEIYPQSIPAVGQIRGSVFSAATPVFGAHVVAVDPTGTAVVSTVSQPDGSYILRFLPPGDYTVYAEPLDLPVTQDHIGGWYTNLNANFRTTFFPRAATFAEAAAVQIPAAGSVASADIQVLPPSVSGLNLTAPSTAPRIARGTSVTLTVGGRDITQGVLFSSLTSALILGSPTFGGEISSTAPTSASMSLRVPDAAPLGPKVITASRSQDIAIGSGAIVIVEPQPSAILVSPASGSVTGNTQVSVTGNNFRPGARVYFGGLPSPGVQVVNANVIEATTPANTPGLVNVQVINADGTNGVAARAYQYTVAPPVISAVSPLSGSGGTTVTIQGSNFDSRLQNVEVRFNGTLARVTSATNTQIETIVPYGATTGPIAVSVFGQSLTGPVFTITASIPSVNVASAIYAFVDASSSAGGTSLSFDSSDDSIAAVSLPFAFTLFEDTYLPGERISVDTNGWVSLIPGAASEFQNGPLPGSTITRPAGGTGTLAPALIAPFFDDLVIANGGTVSTRLLGTAPNQQFVIEWSGMTILDEAGGDQNANLIFEVILFEGSNDIQFVYASMNGMLSDGSSATIGLQNSRRTAAVLTSFNRPFVRSGFLITYRFQNGQYTPILSDGSPPAKPVVADGGVATASTSQLTASWSSEDLESGIREYQYAIGRSPGASDIRVFTSTVETSAVVSGLTLESGTTYYFAVRAVNNAGLTSEAGVSDGIRVDPTIQIYSKVIAFAPQGNDRFTGIALVAPSTVSVVLKAFDSDGNLIRGSDVRNPVTLHISAGQQYARLVNDIFGVTSFDGWIEIEAPVPELGVYSATGSFDGTELDGIVARDTSSDFVIMRPNASVALVNPATRVAAVTIREYGTGITRTLSIPARGRIATTVSAVSRVTSSEPLAAVEWYGPRGRLVIVGAEPVSGAQSALVFPHGAAGAGYTTALTLVNTRDVPFDATVEFASRFATVAVPADGAVTLSLADVFQLGAASLTVGAVRVTAATASSSAGRLLGVIDIATPVSAVSLGARGASADVIFPHVAHENGLLTGLCFATGDRAATVTIDVYPAAGGAPKSATILMQPNQQRAGWLNDFVPAVIGQTGGTIRIRSDQPIWTWEIFISDQTMTSVPPL